MADLNGKRIAIREWGMTAVVWIVGILAEEYGLDVGSVDWVAAIEPRVPIPMPPGARIRYMKPGQTVSNMLDSGEVDGALTIHQVPECFAKGSPRVKRLVLPDYKAAETAYYRRTGVHPMMHCVVLRKDVHAQNPWALGFHLSGHVRGAGEDDGTSERQRRALGHDPVPARGNGRDPRDFRR